MEKQAIISGKDIEIGYSKSKHKNITSLYKHLSFDLYKGELVCLLGVNGAGKSTLLRTISNSQPALNGDILLQEKNISSYSEKELSKLLGLVLTDKTSTGGLLVKELVELGRYPYSGFFGIINQEDKNIIAKAMSDVGIAHKANSYMAELSDGERQKAMIAKVLAQECPIIILDEPTAFLDIESRMEIMNLLHTLAQDQGKTILLSTHDIDLAFLLADRLWLLSKEGGLVTGITEEVILSGKIDTFFSKENVVFNRNTGNFRPKKKTSRNVYLQADEEKYYWIKNMIERYGFAVMEKDNNILFSIIFDNNNSFSIATKDEKIINLKGFEQLADFLKSN